MQRRLLPCQLLWAWPQACSQLVLQQHHHHQGRSLLHAGFQAPAR
jgi:hypothetical protein